MNDRLDQLLDHILDHAGNVFSQTVIDHLGESPDRWDGAALVISCLHGLIHHILEEGTKDDDRSDAAMFTYALSSMTGIVGKFERHPVGKQAMERAAGHVLERKSGEGS